MRTKLLKFLAYKVCKTQEGCLPPKWVVTLSCILFPLYYMYSKQSGIKYDPITKVFTIKGVRLQSEIFDFFNNESAKGTKFKFIKNNLGNITIEQLNS